MVSLRADQPSNESVCKMCNEPSVFNICSECLGDLAEEEAERLLKDYIRVEEPLAVERSGINE